MSAEQQHGTLFHFQRIGFDVQALLANLTASVAAINDSVKALGMYCGEDTSLVIVQQLC